MISRDVQGICETMSPNTHVTLQKNSSNSLIKCNPLENFWYGESNDIGR